MYKGFLSSLFDFSFTEFVTPRIISFIFIAGVVLIGISTLGVIFSGFAADTAYGFVMLLLSPISFLLVVIMLRVYLELIIVLFKIYTGIRSLGTGAGYRNSASPPPQDSSKLDIDI